MTGSRSVDLNSDMGEGFGAYRMGDDAAILKIVTSANVACGMHGGDPEIMAETFRMARENSVSVGAHPGFPDLWGFGRRNMHYSNDEIERLVAYQVGAAQAMATYAGHRITYVKAHGAMANMAAADAGIADAIARAVAAVDRSLVLLCIARTAQVQAAERAGLDIAHEIFADRAYTEEGLLVSRSLPGAVLHDPEEAAARVVRMVRDGALETISGARLETPIDSICVHSDTPTAVALSARVREELEKAQVGLSPFS